MSRASRRREARGRKGGEGGGRSPRDISPFPRRREIKVTNKHGEGSGGVVYVPKSASLEVIQDLRDLKNRKISIMDIDKSKGGAVFAEDHGKASPRYYDMVIYGVCRRVNKWAYRNCHSPRAWTWQSSARLVTL